VLFRSPQNPKTPLTLKMKIEITNYKEKISRIKNESGELHQHKHL